MFRLIRILSWDPFLSIQGRRFFRRLLQMLGDAKKMPHYAGMMPLINETIGGDAKKWFVCIHDSDRAFKKFIPAWYIAQARMKPERLYYRFFKIGAMLLYEHFCLFSVYNIKVDSRARERCLLLSFVKRVYDDLLDIDRIDKQVLFSQDPHPEFLVNPDYRLLLELRQSIRQIAPADRFPNYYALLKTVNDAQGLNPAAAKQAVPYKIKNGFLLDMYIMNNILPQELVQVMDLTTEFYACLDELYDFDEDIAQGKVTPVNQSPDPQAMVEQKFQEIVVYLRAHSPNPEGYLEGMGNLMQNVIFTRRNKLSKLSAFI